MDIYIGSNKPFEEQIITKSSTIISDLDAGYGRSDRDRITIWNNTIYKGEIEYYQDDNLQVIFDGYLNNINKPLQEQLPLIAGRIFSGKPILQDDETGIFNIAIIDRKTDNVFLASDPGALFPLYYCQVDDAFYFFSHMFIFAETFNLKPDPIGIIEKINFTFTFGARTIFDSLRRLNPGELIEYDNNKNCVKVKESEAYFTDYHDYGRDLIEKTWDALNRPFEAHAINNQNMGIMLSEGFDSRLMAGIATKKDFSLQTFTHGTPGTYGIEITFRLANMLEVEYHFDPIAGGFPAGNDVLRSQLFLSDNLSIPYWKNGSDFFSCTNVNSVTTGYALDSTLGGHSFYKPQRKKFTAVLQRYLEIISQDLKLFHEEYVETLSTGLINFMKQNCAPAKLGKTINHSLNEDISSFLNPFLPLIIDDFNSEIDRMNKTGSSLPSEQLQRFFLEHRGRKFSYGQELTIRQHNKVISPSYEPLTMRVLSKIHPKHRIQHKLYLEVLNQKAPYLLTIPNGGYGISPNKPRLLLETSRFIHKYHEEQIIKKYLTTKNPGVLSGLRGANFPEYTYRKGNAISYFQVYFHTNKHLFNEKTLLEKLNQIQNYASKSYQVLDNYQLMEIFTPLSRL